MKEKTRNFLYAIDCYLLYMLSGVISAVGVVAYLSIQEARKIGGIGVDSDTFVEYISDFVSKRSSVVLIVSYILIFAALFIIFSAKKRSLFAYAGMTHMRFKSVLGALLLGVVLNIITYAITPESSAAGGTVNTVLVLCIIIGPFVEELIFRGVLFKMFGASCGVLISGVITSVLFAVSHMDGVQMIYSFFLGIILAVVRFKSTSLWSSTALHLSFNITGAVLMSYAPFFSGKEIFIIALCGILFLMLACSGGRKPKKRRMPCDS